MNAANMENPTNLQKSIDTKFRSKAPKTALTDSMTVSILFTKVFFLKLKMIKKV